MTDTNTHIIDSALKTKAIFFSSIQIDYFSRIGKLNLDYGFRREREESENIEFQLS
jgi:hypothetical protein